jgi:hypothetical protein
MEVLQTSALPLGYGALEEGIDAGTEVPAYVLQSSLLSGCTAIGRASKPGRIGRQLATVAREHCRREC